MTQFATQTSKPHPPDDIVYPEAIPFMLVHLACLGIFWTGAAATDWMLFGVLYLSRMWAVTAGYHRYFSHRSFKTSRLFQFLLAFLAQSSAQRGALWWSATHRQHHRHSDTVEDVHSPARHGFWFAHLGWIFSRTKGKADYSLVKDWRRYPELVWLDRQRFLPAFTLALATGLAGGWSGLLVGFFLSTVLLFHATFFINSLAHVLGRQRYVTGDDSRNNFWLALITMGEGWHNNHHFYPTSVRQGFRWWEVDLTYYVLRLLAALKLVWGLRVPPDHVVAGERRLPKVLVDQVARQLAESFSVEAITGQIRQARQHAPRLEEWLQRVREAGWQAEECLHELHLPHLPHLPTLEDLKRRAQEMYAHTPSLDDIASRAQQLLVHMVYQELQATS